MSIEVNGHQLPPLLVKLIEDGKWVNRQNLPELAVNKILARAGLPAGHPELKMNVLNAEKDWSKFIENPENRLRLFKTFSLASSIESGHDITDDGIVDIDKALFIASNYEDAICLDYRENPEYPCVRAFISTNELFIDWRMIAPDFETFARELGLVE